MTSRANPQKVIVNHTHQLFYCWSWDRWKSLHELGKGGHDGGCFARGCRRMYEPMLPHLRATEVRRASRAGSGF